MSIVAARLESIRDKAGIKDRDIAQLLDTTPETVSRWQTGRTEPRRSSIDRMLALEWLVEELSELYPPEEARLWLFARHRQLGGRAPADLIKGGAVDEVLALIAQLKEGAYV